MIVAARDAYDEAVDWLTQRPATIYGVWSMPFISRAGALFGLCAKARTCKAFTGCLTMVRIGGFDAQTPELTQAIKADERLPKSGGAIRPYHLPAFAEWQRHLDSVLGREPPVWDYEAAEATP